MPLKTRPAHTGVSNTRNTSYVNRFLRSPFVQHLLIAAIVVGYVIGMCYLAAFILGHPVLFVVVIAATVGCVMWLLDGEA